MYSVVGPRRETRRQFPKDSGNTSGRPASQCPEGEMDTWDIHRMEVQVRRARRLGWYRGWGGPESSPFGKRRKEGHCSAFVCTVSTPAPQGLAAVSVLIHSWGSAWGSRIHTRPRWAVVSCGVGGSLVGPRSGGYPQRTGPLPCSVVPRPGEPRPAAR